MMKVLFQGATEIHELQRQAMNDLYATCKNLRENPRKPREIEQIAQFKANEFQCVSMTALIVFVEDYLKIETITQDEDVRK